MSGTQTASFWLDESGSKATAAKCYVVAGIKTRQPDLIERKVQEVRDRHSYSSEFKFGRLSSSTLPIFLDLIDVLEASDARLVATLINSDANPFHKTSIWEAYTNVVTRLVVGNINLGEVGCIFVDRISTPPGIALGTLIKRQANSHLQDQPIVLASSMNSKGSDLLQIADLCAGAIRMERMTSASKPEKQRVARQLATAFGVRDLSEARTARVNIQTMRTTRPNLRR